MFCIFVRSETFQTALVKEGKKKKAVEKILKEIAVKVREV